MKEVKAIEHNGKLFRNEKEALQDELWEGLTTLFSNESGPNILRRIALRRDVQDELVRLIKRYQEGFER